MAMYSSIALRWRHIQATAVTHTKEKGTEVAGGVLPLRARGMGIFWEPNLGVGDCVYIVKTSMPIDQFFKCYRFAS